MSHLALSTNSYFFTSHAMVLLLLANDIWHTQAGTNAFITLCEQLTCAPHMLRSKYMRCAQLKELGCGQVSS